MSWIDFGFLLACWLCNYCYLLLYAVFSCCNTQLNNWVDLKI